MMKLRVRANGRRQRGQSLVEFALIVPVLAVMLSAILEFGLAFDADLSLEAASREGARIGASLGNDGTQGTCPNALSEATVDPAIINAIKASLTSAGVTLSSVKISIFNADTNGAPVILSGVTQINKYKWDTPSSSFVVDGTHAWPSCGRHDGTFGGGSYDDVGVQIDYTYTSKTGLLSFMSSGLHMTARTVMPIGPPWKLQ
jgi:Flp pilus assembly protein TadG